LLAARGVNGTSPVEVKFSPVKEAIEAQSGRLEFLKQALTLGLAGVAGLAALFIDADKVPAGVWIRGVICACGVALLVVAAFAICGIGAYANFLRETETSGNNAGHYRRWIANFINACLVALFVAGLLLIAFAAIRIFSANALGPEKALTTARSFAEQQLTSPAQSLVLDKFASDAADYVVNYVVEPTSVIYVIRVHRASGELDLDRIPPSAPPGH
jgi:hypothetical protein